jgi:hypothetical protein
LLQNRALFARNREFLLGEQGVFLGEQGLPVSSTLAARKVPDSCLDPDRAWTYSARSTSLRDAKTRLTVAAAQS